MCLIFFGQVKLGSLLTVKFRYLKFCSYVKLGILLGGAAG